MEEFLIEDFETDLTDDLQNEIIEEVFSDENINEIIDEIEMEDSQNEEIPELEILDEENITSSGVSYVINYSTSSGSDIDISEIVSELKSLNEKVDDFYSLYELETSSGVKTAHDLFNCSVDDLDPTTFVLFFMCLVFLGVCLFNFVTRKF